MFRSDHISTTLNAWQVECWTIDRDLCEVMGDLANDPTCLTCLELQKWICWIFWNNKMLPRRYLVWLKPPGTQICIRLESCFLDFAFARGKLEIRKGLERCFFEPVWHIICIYVCHIYRTFSHCPFVRLFSMILFVASETTRLSRRWCWLLACWADGYCRGTLSLSKNSQTVQTVWLYHCTKRSRVQCHLDLPAFALIWEMDLISGDLWTCRRRPSSLVSTRHMAKHLEW